PMLDLEGATVGGWRTMVEAVAVHTLGLGGDSEVRLDKEDGLVVGPQRVVPLSLLGHQHPNILDSLRGQTTGDSVGPYDGQFALRQRPLGPRGGSLSATQEEIWNRLAEGPTPLAALFGDFRRAYFQRRALARLVERGLVVLASFTPTDAAHVLGYHHDWSVQAAGLGAELWARRAAQSPWELDGNPDDFCQHVMRRVTV
ncbi:MAG: hydantoinase/oxoprolinase family protein, partial [Anaerolineae bacterium]|nr:hydantoinase/oxoprolinase family protein [Anaerolineae bacterium]NIQ77738.1 hydantoinase/oxoprolinase family protein [Anaerolineae bacterium]